MASVSKQARITGVLYLLLALIGPFSLMYVPSRIIVAGDAAATASNILANGALFRLGIVGESLIFLIETAIVALLYIIFKSVSKPWSMIAAFARLAMTVIQGINIMNYLFALEVLTNPGYADALGGAQVNSLASLFINGHAYGVYTWQIFFGFHLIVLGYLILRSGYVPKVIGGLLVLGSLGYLVDSYGRMLAPAGGVAASVASVLLVVATVAELSFTLWLIFKGVRVPENA